jgi:iron complex outermembrane receptor protein
MPRNFNNYEFLQEDRMKKSKKYMLSTAVAAALVPTASYAQLEEVVVTAQKREQSLQDVPITISAISQELIEQTGINTITEVIPMVPGLTGSDYGLATNTWAIRGISSNDWTIGSEPSVGVFFDDAYVGRNIFATTTFFDINRIEVVKGPQGTLFGRNAAAGAISLISNRPGDENELRLGVSLGDEGQERYEVVGNWAVSDSFALRLSYQHQEWEGMWEEINSGDDAYVESDYVRLMARWDVTDNIEALFRFNYGDVETNYTSVVNIPTNLADPGEEYPDKYAINRPNSEENEDEGFGLRLNWQINDSLSLVSITDVRSGENDYFEDVDGTADDVAIDEALFGVPGGAVGGLDVPVGLGGDADTVYQEFRLNGGSDSLTWFTGVSYYYEDLENTRWSVDYVATALGFPLGSQRIESDAENESYGIYGDVTWMVTEKLALIGGMRWSYDDKDWCTNTLQDDFGDMGGPTDGELCDNEDWDEVTSRLVAQYDIADDIMVFASVAEGYKGGGFNTAVADLDGDGIAETLVPFDTETSIAFEVGVKSSLLDGRMQFNGSAYFTDYEDIQLATFNFDTGQQVRNAGDAETKGVEMELTYAPIDGLVLMANYAYLDAELTSGQLDGNTLPYAPENTFSIGANIDHGFLGGNLNWFAVYNYQDDFDHDQDNLYEEDAYGLLNAKVTYTAGSERWDLAVAGDNLTDEDYATIRTDFGWGPMLHWGYQRMVRTEFNLYY